MAKFEELQAEKARWDDFGKRMGIKIDDMQIQSLQCLITLGDKRAMMPLWLRDQILAKTTWREQDKPALKEVGNG